MNTITRPAYASTELSDALRRDWRGHHLSQKMDGCWHVAQFNGSTITGERMRDGTFYGFDITHHEGQDLRRCVWRDRSEALIDCAARYGFPLAPHGTGAGFIESVIANGGEGCVAKPLGAYFGCGWVKIKAVKTYDVQVIGKTQGAIEIAYEGAPAGKCPLYNPSRVRIGDIVEIRAFARYGSGKFKSPVLVRTRHDKT